MAQDNLFTLDRAKPAVKFCEARVALINARDAYASVIDASAAEPPKEIINQITRLEQALICLSLVH